MTAPTPYLHLPGTARDALHRWAAVFGGTVELHTFAELGRTDGPAQSVAHGLLVDGPVALLAADTGTGEPALRTEGLMLALLGTAEPAVLRTWFAGLADGGRVVDDLQRRAWGACDGQVVDPFGVHWLVGFEGEG
jgi:PhnB protein